MSDDRNEKRQYGAGFEAARDVVCLPAMIVNVFLIGESGRAGWTLVDTGVTGSTGRIVDAAAERFGRRSRPAAIVLTHGHFDHVGAVLELSDQWDVPIYAHRLELPYLTGEADYPPPDPSVGGGLMARISPLYPHRGIDLGGRVQALPENGRVPSLPEWRWIHVPGHTPGQVALFREKDRLLIAADAFTTVKQESAWAVMTQNEEVHGPPAYFTPDWSGARESVARLQALEPVMVLSSHGHPMSGQELGEQLDTLVEEFDRVAIPDHGKYVYDPEPPRA